jgi:hypothetical protein
MTFMFGAPFSGRLNRPNRCYSGLHCTGVLAATKVFTEHDKHLRPAYHVRVPKPLYRDMTEARRQGQARVGMRVTPPSPASGASASNGTKHWTGVLTAKRPQAVGVQWLGEIEYTL